MTQPIVETFEEVTDLAPVDNNQPSGIASPADYYCSMPVETREEAMALAKALSNAESLDDHIGEVYHLENYVIQPVRLTDRETGEVRDANRIVLMCEEGNFGTASTGVETSMRNIVTAMKKFPAPWTPGIAFKAVKIQGTNGYKFTSLEWLD